MRWMAMIAGVAVLAGAGMRMDAQQAGAAKSAQSKPASHDGDDGISHRSER